jgi:hypothetical protein
MLTKAFEILRHSRYRFGSVSFKLELSVFAAARIGKGILMDHGTGVVIGETAVVGDRVSLLQVGTPFFHSHFAFRSMCPVRMRASYLDTVLVRCEGIACLRLLRQSLHSENICFGTDGAKGGTIVSSRLLHQVHIYFCA